MQRIVYIVEALEQGHDLLCYLQAPQRDDQPLTVIAFEPGVRALLERHGVPCLDTLAFFNNRWHAALLEESQRVTQWIVADLRIDLGDDLNDAYVEEFTLYFIHLWMLMRKTIEMLNAIHLAYPDAVYCVPARRGSDQSFLHVLGPKFCECHHIPFKIVPAVQAVDQSEKSSASGLKRFSTKIFKAFGGVADQLIGSMYLAAIESLSQSATLFTPLAFANLDVLFAGISNQFPDVKLVVMRTARHRRRAEIRQALSWRIRTAIRQEPHNRTRTIPIEFVGQAAKAGDNGAASAFIDQAVVAWLTRNHDRFVYRDIDCTDALLSETRRFVLPRVATVYRLARMEDYLIKRLRPKLVIAPFSYQVARPISKLARKNATPAMVIPSKTLVMHGDPLGVIGESHVGREIVTNDYTYAAVQTPLALGYLDGTGFAGKKILTGPLVWVKVNHLKRERLREQFFASTGAPGKIVMYAPSARRIPYFHVVETMDEVLSSMADIVAAMGHLEHAYLVIRLHPDHYIGRSDVETLINLPGNVVINDSSRESFVDALSLADVLISNASTTTEEALQNRIPVILYDKWARYNHLNAPTVHGIIPDGPSPAYYVTSQAQLTSTLTWVLENQAANLPIPVDLMARYVFPQDLSRNFYDFLARILRVQSNQEI